MSRLIVYLSLYVPLNQSKSGHVERAKKGKAAGIDNIPSKVLTVDLDTTANMLHPLLRRFGMKAKCLRTGNVVY